jgi:glycosyltransferase involved in cell wall biosynthesis
VECGKWQNECSNCLLKRDYPSSFFLDNSNRNFKRKKELFTNKKNLCIVPVSHWLEDLVRFSFFTSNYIKTIHNGVDLDVFNPNAKSQNVMNYDVNKSIILGVASPWDKRKGLDDFIQLRSYLDDSYTIILVGLSDEQINGLPNGIIGLKRTNNIDELAALYSKASVYVNPTYSDNFPTTNIEALACGTPVITYQTGGSPEAIDDRTGIVVPKGDIKGLVSAIKKIKDNPFSSDDCRKRAVLLYNKDERVMEYIRLYEELLKENKNEYGI